MIKIGRTNDSESALLAYPGVGYFDQNRWRLRVAGVAWQTPVVLSMRKRMMIRMLGGVMQASPDDLEGETFRSRITPFMADADHRKSLIITIGSQSHRLRRKTKRNGHFAGWLTLDDSVIQSNIQNEGNGQTISFQAVIDGLEETRTEGKIFLFKPGGTSVISDIDDTIKDSAVGDRRELLANTFLREFRSIEGMSELYQQWAVKGIGFHYVSSSPWQLFDSLTGLQDNLGFPTGTMHLRNFRLRDQLLKRVIIRREGKTLAIRQLIKQMPGRRFVLIGDSGEKDPKIYRKICRKHPDQIKAVLIRDLPHKPMDQERLGKLKGALKNGICEKFSDANELAALTKDLFV